ncbi:MAG: Gfo/Idh/MocA family oxidoreductase [Fibrobacterales bacterium]
MTTINFALIGCGRIAFKHFEAIENIPDARIVAICDKKEPHVKQIAKEQNCDWYTSFTDMLTRDDIDVVVIATPSGLHPTHGIQAAQAGKHILTEKPMSTNYKEAKKLIRTCDENNVQLHVVHQNRLNTTIDTLKKAIDKGRFGKIYSVQVNVFWTRPQEYYDSSSWRGTWEFDGGAFMNQASHYVDLLEYLIGEVDSVMAYTATLERKIEAEDSGVVAMKFRNGALGTMNVSMLTYPKNLEGSITILGETGTVKIGGVAVNKVDQWEFKDYDDDDKVIFEKSYDTQSVYGFGHTGYYKNVIRSIQTGEEPEVCGRKGLKSLELILAIYKSAKEQTRVPLPLDL